MASQNIVASDIPTTVSMNGNPHATYGQSAFRDILHVLKHVEIGDEVTYLVKYAFYGALKLETVVLSEGLQSIGENAFSRNYVLREVNLANVTAIGKNAFNSCWKMKSMDLRSIVDIGDFAFHDTRLLDIVVSDHMSPLFEYPRLHIEFSGTIEFVTVQNLKDLNLLIHGIQVGHSKFDQIEFTVCLQVLCSIVLEYHNAEPGQYKISVWISCDESVISMFDPCHFVCCLYENGGWYILQQHAVVRNSFFYVHPIVGFYQRPSLIHEIKKWSDCSKNATSPMIIKSDLPDDLGC